MRKALLSLAGLLIAPAAALVLPSAAQATATEECRTVVVNDRVGPDSGENGNDWATATLDRTTKVCVVGQVQPDVTQYKATISDAGTFVTRPGDSPGAGTAAKLAGGFPGDVVGGFSATFTAKPGFESYTPDALQNAAFTTTSAWVKTLFADAVFDAKGAVAGWGWTYTTCGGNGEKWVNAEAGNSGDITEKACRATGTPSTSSPAAGGSAGELPVTGSQVGLIGGVGAALVGVGALVVFLAARRRRRFEA